MYDEIVDPFWLINRKINPWELLTPLFKFTFLDNLMKPIEGVELSELLSSVSRDVLAERRMGVAGTIKTLLLRHEQLVEESKKVANELKKVQEKVEKSSARIEKLKVGDWSVLDESQSNKEDNKSNV